MDTNNDGDSSDELAVTPTIPPDETGKLTRMLPFGNIRQSLTYCQESRIGVLRLISERTQGLGVIDNGYDQATD